MAATVTIDLRQLARSLKLPVHQVQAVVELLDEGNTVPFISRYRKDRTGGLDEVQVRCVQAELARNRQLAERKQSILRSIEAQGKLTEELTTKILGATTPKWLEDLYLPFKPRKQSLASQARQRGLEPLAQEILAAAPGSADLDARAADFVNPDRQVASPADALLGAGHILAEEFSERADLRQKLRQILYRTGRLVATPSERIEKLEKAAQQSKAEAAKPKPSQAAADPGPPVDQPAAVVSEALAEPPNDASPSELPSNDAASKPTVAAADESPEQPAASPVLEAAGEAVEQPASEPVQEPSLEPVVESAPEPGVEASADQAVPPCTEATDTPAPPTEPSTAEPSTAEPPTAPSEPAAAQAEDAGQSVEASAEPSSAQPSDAASEPSKPAARKAKQPAAKKQKPVTLSKRELRKQKADEKRIKAFRDYFDYQEEIRKIPHHRILAINRGERAKVLRVRIECDLDAMHAATQELLVPSDHPHADYLWGCAKDSLGRLVLPALEREMRRDLTDRAESHAVTVFAKNLRNLLLQPPIRNHRVLAIDPGFKSGCKLAALDQFGNVLDHGVIYLIGKSDRRKPAAQKIVDLVRRYQLNVVAIGNGTACRETEEFIAELLSGELKEDGLAYVIVNEAGASVYSASPIGREEFPSYDVSLRGAISIGRRLQDPLSELVKIDAANIGVGLYQHDVKAKHLRDSLDGVVESCVNYVGVDVNSASPALLRYVSGLNQLTARRVYDYRRQHGPFRSREQLREVPGFGAATFVQAAGFLKISSNGNPLDATWIHPESYDIVAEVLKKLGCSLQDLSDKQKAAVLSERTAEIDLEATAQELEVGTLLLSDILAQLARPGRDPRDDLPEPVFKRGVLKLEDLSPGMSLTGTVLNVVDFGAFVDIGLHDSGLVHVSQLANHFVQDPHEVVAVGNIVKVWVLGVDKERRRVSLTMIPPGAQHAPRRRDAKPQRQEGEQAPGKRRSQPRREAKPATARQTRQEGRPARPSRPPQRRPKPSRPPAKPITEAMKTGKEPMRSFGQLIQYFQEDAGASNGQGQSDQKQSEAPAPKPAETPAKSQDAEPSGDHD